MFVCNHMRRYYAGTDAASLIEAALWYTNFTEDAAVGSLSLTIPHYPVHARNVGSLEELETHTFRSAYAINVQRDDDVAYVLDQLRLRSVLCGAPSMLRDLARLQAKAHLQQEEYEDALYSYIRFGTREETRRDLRDLDDVRWKALFAVGVASMPSFLKLTEVFGAEARANLAEVLRFLLTRQTVSIESRLQLFPSVVRFLDVAAYNFIGNFNSLSPAVDMIKDLVSEAGPSVVALHRPLLASALERLLTTSNDLAIQESVLQVARFAIQIDQFATDHGLSLLTRVLELLERVSAETAWPVSATTLWILSLKNASDLLLRADDLLARAQQQARRFLNSETTLGRQQPDLLLRVYSSLGILTDEIRDMSVASATREAANPHSSESVWKLLQMLKSRDVLKKHDLDQIVRRTVELIQWRDHRGSFIFTIAQAAFLAL